VFVLNGSPMLKPGAHVILGLNLEIRQAVGHVHRGQALLGFEGAGHAMKSYD